MADIIFLAKKQEVVDIIKARRCKAAEFVYHNANSYQELLEMLFEYSKVFNCDPTYLDELLAPFSDLDLTSNGVYYNKDGDILVNPTFVVKSTNVSIIVNQGGSYPELDITYQSTVTSVEVMNNTQMGLLNIGGGSTVDMLSVEAGSCINTLAVRACEEYKSTLSKVVDGSCINNIGIDDCAIYGGYECLLNPVPAP